MGTRKPTSNRSHTLPTGKIDLDSIALLASTCGNAAAATAALVEKRFAQSRQELLEQRHQELLRKQRQLQEQYTRLQQLSRGQIPQGFLSDLKKTGSESNIVSKTMVASADHMANKVARVPLSSTVHGSLRNLATGPATTATTTTTTTSGSSVSQSKSNPQSAKLADQVSNETVATAKKIFETDIL